MWGKSIGFMRGQIPKLGFDSDTKKTVSIYFAFLNSLINLTGRTLKFVKILDLDGESWEIKIK